MENKTTYRLKKLACEITEKNYGLMVGRAAFGLYATLCILGRSSKNRKIGIPALICQSPLAAIRLAGWQPIFCDIDLATGNVRIAEWIRVMNQGVDAVLCVNLYGNIVEPDLLATACKEKNIFMIEDIAQSFGGSYLGRGAGSFGDIAIASFGHTKPIDAGHGGIVMTNDLVLLNEIQKFTENFKYKIIDRVNRSNSFKERYYEARRAIEISPCIDKTKFLNLINYYEPLVFLKWNENFASKILSKLEMIKTISTVNRNRAFICNKVLEKTPFLPIIFSEGSIPWRSVFRLKGVSYLEQAKISNKIRKMDINVSNWYLPVYWMLGSNLDSHFVAPTSEIFSREVFQFWVNDGKSTNDLERDLTVISEIVCSEMN
jgi:hypothetical protein